MRKIYIYETPASKELGLIKIGDALDVRKRIDEQVKTAAAFDSSAIEYDLLYECDAVKDDGSEFRDHAIHAILEMKGYSKHQITDGAKVIKSTTEWFKIDLDKVENLINQFKQGKRPEEIDIERFQSFGMRPEQKQAVDQTVSYFNGRVNGSQVTEMLWNAKMRFGKTFTAYQLALAMGFHKVLVLTYKPAVEDAWKKDLEHHVDFKDYLFLCRESLLNIKSHLNDGKRIVAFASYQDLLGKDGAGNDIKDKHLDVFNIHWDLVIIDEFHYGAGTKKAREMMVNEIETIKDSVSKGATSEIDELIFSEEDESREEEKETEVVEEMVKAITSDFRLYLSGTPFKAMVEGRFDKEAVFNWTYTDEQKAKDEWNKSHPNQLDANPYRSLPRIEMFLYKVSSELIQAGIAEGKNEFSLNHFFKAKNKRFINEEAVNKWLNLISGVIRPHIAVEEEIGDEVKHQPSQYPFDHEGKLFNELDHTLWYLSRVDSAYALRDALKNHAVFKHYHIILAAGKEMKSGVDAVQPLLDAIDKHDKTITISVGKLTTGVSVPKWKGVMFLRDIASPENYFQTAFRAQTPYRNRKTGELKERCFVFDFSPNRSLKLLTTYSEKLSSDSYKSTSEEKLTEFIRYLPVLKVAGNRMVEMDARDVMTFDLSGIDAKGLGQRFVERRNIIVTRETIDAISSDLDVKNRCKDIFERIKMFRRFNGANDSEMKDADIDIDKLDVNNKKIKKLETKEPGSDKEEKEKKKEMDKVEKEQKSEREKIRELLSTLLSRMPVFMYLTDATEENLKQVLVETEDDLFRKTTGITIADFQYLIDMGLIRIDSIDGYIMKFAEIENQNFAEFNTMNKGKVQSPAG